MLYEKIIYGPDCSFSKRSFRYKYFPSKWHYHKEFELVLITSGDGKRFIGDSVADFKSGDLVLIGDNVPHFHMSSPLYYKDNELSCSSEVIQFTRSIFPENMGNMHEFNSISDLLFTSVHGIKFTDKKVLADVRAAFNRMNDLQGMHRLLEFYKILQQLSECRSTELLSAFSFHEKYQQEELNHPVNKTYEYLITHFKEMITLQEVADYAGQNHTALCRNFKRSTGKSIFDCLAEIRIGFACKLLLNSDFSILQVAYESGYSNISHFNHKFRDFTGMAPTEYRKINRSKSRR